MIRKSHLHQMLISGLVFCTLGLSLPSFTYAGWKMVTAPNVSSYWSLNSLHFSDRDKGWAVGSDFTNKRGVILRYTSGTWAVVSPPAVSSDWELFSVYFPSATTGWAVGRDNLGKKGVLLRYSGGTWLNVAPPTVSSDWQLNGVHFGSLTEGWAVGEDRTASITLAGVLLHFADGVWTKSNPPYVTSSWTLNGAHFPTPSAAEGWAVGDSQTLFQNQGVLLRYESGNWVSITSPNVGTDWDLRNIHFTSTDEGWAVGNDYQYPIKTGLLFHFANDSWTLIRPSHTSTSWFLNGLHFISADEGWVVGIDRPSSFTQKGLLLRYLDGVWSFVDPPQVSSNWDLFSVHFTSAHEGWAAGGDSIHGRGVLLRFVHRPEISVTPVSVDFDNLSPGGTKIQKVTISNRGGVDLTVQTIGNPATPFSREGGTCQPGKALAAGERCTVVIKFAPLANGLYNSSFDITSDDPDDPSVTVDLDGSAGPPDLTGDWVALTQECRTTSSGTKCKLKGTLTIRNEGYLDGKSSYVYFYLSDDATLGLGDVLLKKTAVGKVKVSLSRSVTFSFSLRTGESASGKYVIAVVDGKSKIVEVDETNNEIPGLVP